MFRIYEQGGVYLVTIVTKGRYPYLNDSRKGMVLKELFLLEIKYIKELKDFQINAFAILPDHAHLLIQVREKYNISEIMHSLKRHFSRNANLLLGRTYQIHRTAKDSHPLLCKIDNYVHNNRFSDKNRKFGWQKSFYASLLDTDRAYLQAYNYVVANHMLHGLHEDYVYVSTNYEELVDPLL